MKGIGGKVTLLSDRIIIERRGTLFSLVNFLYHVEREIRTTIFLRDLVGAHLVQSIMLVQFLRFTYAGCPIPDGHYLKDAFSENAFMLSLFDNRPLLEFLLQIEGAVSALSAQPR
jgi:hypothetical protein